MVLTLRSEIDDNVFAKIDFDYVSSVGIDVGIGARWTTTQITMKDGTVVRVRETPYEIMKMLEDGHAREKLIEGLDRVMTNE